MNAKLKCVPLLQKPHIVKALTGVGLLRAPETNISPEVFVALIKDDDLEDNLSFAIAAEASAECEHHRAYWRDVIACLTQQTNAHSREL
jgi:hypothetical protein